MFDVSFSELALILIVGLLVFGPEKLPEVVRTASTWISKIRRSFNQIRSEIEREVGVDEIKREIHNQSILDSLKDVRNDLHRAHQDLRDLPYDIKDVVDRHEVPAEPLHLEKPPAAVTPTLASTNPDDDFRHNDTVPIDDFASIDAPEPEPVRTNSAFIDAPTKPSSSQSS
ncbi:MAG: twin arginine-targeting protein translocase TatB [Verrucomicrobiaceae bacterium]|nr:twin arginine-targeting protein translocase TatB [Verrucomicrobiaceae bacterium]